jgi:hypothetical protein
MKMKKLWNKEKPNLIYCIILKERRSKVEAIFRLGRICTREWSSQKR